jgi:hypothetical protein
MISEIMSKKISAKGARPSVRRKSVHYGKAKKYFFCVVIIVAACILFPLASKAETLKIGFVTDWEYGSQKKYTHKLPSRAVSYITKAVNYFNSEFKPDLIVGGGDYVLGARIKKKTALRQLNFINQVFRRTEAPRLYCIGNHDLLKLTKEEVKQALGIDYSHSATDIGGVRIITLDTNNLVPGRKGYGATGRVSAEELAWLDLQLDTDLPVIVFSHHSPIETPEGKKLRTNIVASGELRGVLEKHNNVVAVFSGHHAINYLEEVNGIKYVIINNLSDIKAPGTFAAINIIKNEENEVSLHIDQFGKKPANHDFSKTMPLN